MIIIALNASDISWCVTERGGIQLDAFRYRVILACKY